MAYVRFAVDRPGEPPTTGRERVMNGPSHLYKCYSAGARGLQEGGQGVKDQQSSVMLLQ